MPGHSLLQQLISPGEYWQLRHVAHTSSSLTDFFLPEPPYLRLSSVFSHIAVAFHDSPHSNGESSDSAGASDTASAYVRKAWITKAWISGPVGQPKLIIRAMNCSFVSCSCSNDIMFLQNEPRDTIPQGTVKSPLGHWLKGMDLSPDLLGGTARLVLLLL